MASRFCFFRSVASVGAPARWLALAATAVACGGVSEERVASLEANLAALKQASASDSGVNLKGRVDAVETSTAASIQKMEEIMEILQREVTALSAASGGGEAGAEGTHAGQQSSGDGDSVWLAVGDILGVAAEGISVDDDSYSVNRAWLIYQARKQASGKVPRFVAGKKGGVTVRGVKAKTLLGRLGVANNDTIVAVGETETNTPQELFDALKAAGGAVQVKVMRKKQERVLQYTVVD